MSTFLQEVAGYLYAQFGDRLRDVALVFNNKRPVNYMKQHLAACFKKPYWSPSFFTVQDLFARSSNLPVADPFTQFFEIFKAYNRLMEAEGLPAIDASIFYTMGQTLVSDFAQIDADLVPYRELFGELADIAVIQQEFSHLSDEQQDFLSRFWASFSTSGQSVHQQQFIKMWRRMPQLYEKFHEGLVAAGLTTHGMVYRKLATGTADTPNFTDAFTHLVFIGFNALSRSESIVFKRWQDDGKALFFFDTDPYYLDDELHEAGTFIRRNLLNGLRNIPLSNLPGIRRDQRTITVYEAQGKTAQAAIANDVLSAHYPALKQGDPASQAVLVLADEDALMAVLQRIPARWADTASASKSEHVLPLNVTMGYAFRASSLYDLADLWIRTQEQIGAKQRKTIEIAEARRYVSHPLLSVGHHVVETLQVLLDDPMTADIRIDTLASVDEFSVLFFQPVERGAECAGQLYALFESVLYRLITDGVLKEIDSNLMTALLKELNHIHEIFEKNPDIVSSRLALILIRKAIQGLTVPLEGEPLEGLQVMGLLETRNLDFAHVCLMDASEGHLPKTSKIASFIPGSIRRAHGLPVPENQDAIFAYVFYRLLQRSQTFTVIYNTQHDDGHAGEPSRFLKQLAYESGYQFDFQKHIQPVVAHLRKRFDIAKNVESLKSLTISATAFTTYLTCPMWFYYKLVAGIKEAPTPSRALDPAQIGTLIHRVLELFYRRLLTVNAWISPENISEGMADVDRLSRSALSEIVHGNMGGLNEVTLAIVNKYCKAILTHDQKVAPFHIIELENKNDFFLPVAISIGGKTQEVMLRGIIDRVDQKDGVTRIVDYKTGKDKLHWVDMEALFDPESKKGNKALLQTLFYTYIYEKVRKKDGVEPHLYVARTIEQGETKFQNKRLKLILQDRVLEESKISFEAHLKSTLEEMFDPSIPFKQTQVEENCIYCPYKVLCGK